MLARCCVNVPRRLLPTFTFFLAVAIARDKQRRLRAISHLLRRHSEYPRASTYILMGHPDPPHQRDLTSDTGTHQPLGFDRLTGTDAAAICSSVLRRTTEYAGDDMTASEQNLHNVVPDWMAYDMRLMAERLIHDSIVPGLDDVLYLTAMLGGRLRSFRDYVAAIDN